MPVVRTKPLGSSEPRIRMFLRTITTYRPLTSTKRCNRFLSGQSHFVRRYIWRNLYQNYISTYKSGSVLGTIVASIGNIVATTLTSFTRKGYTLCNRLGATSYSSRRMEDYVPSRLKDDVLRCGIRLLTGCSPLRQRLGTSVEHSLYSPPVR